MTAPVTLPLWIFVLLMLFAGVTFASHFLFPSVRWFFRRRLERAVSRLNERLERPIEPFRLLRRYDLIQRLVYDPEVTQAIVDHARSEGVREDVAFERARRYAREIVPSFSAFTYFGWGVRLARLLSNALYRVRLGHHDPEAFARVPKDATILFVMNHRSNMDYLLVTYLAAERSALSYAAGEWARVWPLSSRSPRRWARISSAGARATRSTVGCCARYVQMATEGGVTQAVFPEGGLSLDGALRRAPSGPAAIHPRRGDLAARDRVFVPGGASTTTGCSRIASCWRRTRADAGSSARISRVRGHARQMWQRLTGRFHKFGYAAVSDGPAAVSLRENPALAADAELPGECADGPHRGHRAASCPCRWSASCCRARKPRRSRNRVFAPALDRLADGP